MTARSTECFVWAVSFRKIAIKARLRRKDFRVDMDRLIEACLAAGMRLLPFTLAHALRVARLPRHHADPFDLAFVTQASVEPLILLTHEAKLAPYGGAVRVAWRALVRSPGRREA